MGAHSATFIVLMNDQQVCEANKTAAVFFIDICGNEKQIASFMRLVYIDKVYCVSS
jgi:hypothetical protein